MNILETRTIDFTPECDGVVIIDQTLLPGREVLAVLRTQEEIWQAIFRLQVRGAPAIGIAAGMGLFLAAREIAADGWDGFHSALKERKAYLASSRPTAVNLFWALDRMERCALAHKDEPIPAVVDALRLEALAMRDEDIAVCEAIGEHGSSLIREGMGILTHCNAGSLCAVRYGTALAPIYRAKEKGMTVHVFCDETRPLLQGARLTAYELMSAGVDTCLLCDNMASSIMAAGKIQLVLVGCDRVAANGDTANKIGTSGVAILAKHYGIPFYVCAPTSTIDRSTADGAGIEIEQRSSDEVTELWYRERMAPAGVGVFNPAFDVTDHALISGFITERGILQPPFEWEEDR